jgi:hypothetical protein
MLIEIEVRVLDPSRAMQLRGNLDESSTEWRNQVEAILDEPAHLAKEYPSAAVEGSKTQVIPTCKGAAGVSR